MKDFKLYIILDKQLLKDKDIVDTAKELIDGGVDIIQYRDKISSQNEILRNAEKLRRLDFPLIINDYPHIAVAVDAQGVHLGQDDIDTWTAREILGDIIIGRSTHNLKQALLAEKQGADYIGIGPVFATTTKKDAVPIGLEVLKEISANIKIPAFAVGGIAPYNIDNVLSTGITRVAVASAILCSDNMKKTMEEFKRLLYGQDRAQINCKG